MRAHVHSVNVRLSLIRALRHLPRACVELEFTFSFFFSKCKRSRQGKNRVVRDVPAKLAWCDAFQLWKHKYRNIATSCGLSSMTLFPADGNAFPWNCGPTTLWLYCNQLAAVRLYVFSCKKEKNASGPCWRMEAKFCAEILRDWLWHWCSFFVCVLVLFFPYRYV